MSQSKLNRIRGPNLTLRLIQSEDAAYVYGLRTDPAYNGHLSTVQGTVEDQRNWIEIYKLREAEGTEYYYVIERNDGSRCGVVRLYEIMADQFTWGSWILDHNKPPKAALESAILSFGVGFYLLDKSKAIVDVRIKNDHAIAFYRRIGMDQIGCDDQSVYFSFLRSRFDEDRGTRLEFLASILNDESPARGNFLQS